ncbi:MAG: uracil-DNA glycosylase family protein [Mangrovibacterium sp.]
MQKNKSDREMTNDESAGGNKIYIDTDRRRCKACGLYLNQLPVLDKGKRSNVFWVGLSSVLITDEDEKIPLSPFTKTGALISQIEEPFRNDISFYKTNVVKCLPLMNNKIRYPLKHEMEKCYPNLVDEIAILNPSVIFLLGKEVAQFVLGKQRYNSFSLDDDFNYQSFNIDGILYVPVHHPSFILVYRRKFIDKYMSAVSTFFQELPVPAGV